MSDLVERLRKPCPETTCPGCIIDREVAADELDRLNAQALELCAEISGLRRERDLADAALHSLQTRWANRATEQELRGLLQRHYELRGKPAREEWVDGGPTYRLAMQLWRDTDAALAGAAVQPNDATEVKP